MYSSGIRGEEMITISLSAVNGASIKFILAVIIVITLLIYYVSYIEKSLYWLFFGVICTFACVIYGIMVFNIPFPQLIQVVP